MAADPLAAKRDALRAWIEARCLFTAEREVLMNSRGERQAWMFDLRPALLDGWAATAAAGFAPRSSRWTPGVQPASTGPVIAVSPWRTSTSVVIGPP